ncbi:retropepsin-like aspartic protease [Tunicatimonas pelagia]|uniref:retropepsin-like aspartic protease n=1 Tax=Tunicatimonas pelagia TaxID=931531 RepID=UPI002666D8D0|nr:retropepsin-like aspartic protease [Tunicatimonas pelagia]WKN43710.1 retropepsin-like aspartic protease [Tunicatimonas pelagia]
MRLILIIISFLLSTNTAVYAQDRYEYIDIHTMRDQPIVKGTINGKEAFFLLDTGADVSLIHINDAKRYGFSYHTRHSRQGFRVTGLGASVKGLVGVYGMNLEIGSQKIIDDYIAVDLSNIIRTLHTGSTVRISGIIGCKALRLHGFVIDYHHKKVKMKLPSSK